MEDAPPAMEAPPPLRVAALSGHVLGRAGAAAADMLASFLVEHANTALRMWFGDAAIEAFAGTGRPYIQISGLWGYGSNSAISEDSPANAPALVAWREPIERRVLDEASMRGVVIVSGTAYGDGGGGIPGVLLSSPRDEAGNLVMLGTGRQHWSTVHVADLADVFRRVLEDDSARGRYVVGDGTNPTVAELTEATAVAHTAPMPQAAEARSTSAARSPNQPASTPAVLPRSADATYWSSPHHTMMIAALIAAPRKTAIALAT
jgi:hypothetical protein